MVTKINLKKFIFSLLIFVCLNSIYFPFFVHAKEVKYDENTEIVVNGVVSRTFLNSSFNPSENWHYFALDTTDKRYIILTAPHWYVRKIQLNLMDGMPLSVVGSKFMINEKITYILAKSIKSPLNGKFYLFRDKNGTPLWELSGISESSCINSKPAYY